MKRLIPVAVLALTTMVVPPAHAAMPPTPPSEALECRDDDKRIGKGSAKVWVVSGEQLAATNPCTYPLMIHWWFGDSARENVIAVAPGKKFNWDAAHAPKKGFQFPKGTEDHGWGASLLLPKYACRHPQRSYEYAVKVYAWNDVRPLVACVNRNGEWRKP